jgi:Type VI secretion system effector, Hcp/PEP-CTERM motif
MRFAISRPKWCQSRTKLQQLCKSVHLDSKLDRDRLLNRIKLGGLVKRTHLNFCLAVVGFALAAFNAAQADVVYDLNLPGIGSQIPILSYSFGNGNTLSVTKPFDTFSPLLFSAVTSGTLFSIGSFDTYDTSLSTSVAITSFEMSNILLTSLQFGGGGGTVPIETLTLHYEAGTLVSNTVPEPPSIVLLTSGLGLAGFVRRRLRN